MEANRDKQLEYIDSIKEIEKKMLVYVDESGIEMNICKDRGWCKKGKILSGRRSGKYYQRTNIIAGLSGNESIAPMVFNGSCNTELFNRWVEEFLIKKLKPGQVIIMDNASFHKSEKTKLLIESVGCQLIFLPPYSPELNPIEKFWANMKRWIRENMAIFTNLHLALNAFFNIGNST